MIRADMTCERSESSTLRRTRFRYIYRHGDLMDFAPAFVDLVETVFDFLKDRRLCQCRDTLCLPLQVF